MGFLVCCLATCLFSSNMCLLPSNVGVFMTFVPVMKAETRVASFLHPLLTIPSFGGCGGWAWLPLEGAWLCFQGLVEYRV